MNLHTTRKERTTTKNAIDAAKMQWGDSPFQSFERVFCCDVSKILDDCNAIEDECIRLRREVAWLRDAGSGDWPVEFMAEDIVWFIQKQLRRQPPKDWQPLKEPA